MVMDPKEKLVQLIKKASYECDEGTRDLYDMREVADSIADFLIANGVTVQEWISVDDRLPEFGVPVLARCFYHGKWMTLVCHTSKENAGELYTDEVCQWVKVTYWMPLPKPPKGE